MKLIRNVAFVVIGVAWLVSGRASVSVQARGGEACNIECDWGPGDCCNVGNMACGQEYGGIGLCAYCGNGSGEQMATTCSAEVAGDTYEGTVCQCESEAQ